METQKVTEVNGVPLTQQVMATQGINVELKALVTFAKPYRVAEGGTTNEGITINYLLTQSLAACENPSDKSKGYKFSKSSIPLDREFKLTRVPGIYNLHCIMGVGSNGAPVLKPVDLDLLNICNLEILELSNEEESSKEVPTFVLPVGDSLEEAAQDSKVNVSKSKGKK